MSTDDDWLSNALPFEFFDDCAKSVEKKWLLKGLVALGEDSSWFGPPGSLKSSLLLDMAFNIAWRRDWRGHQYSAPEDENFDNAEPRASIYFALERADLVRARMGAYKARDKPEVPLPIGIVSRVINLLDPACVEQIAETVWKMEDLTKVPVGLLIFDTFSKAISSGDEDKAQTQNLAAANLTRIHEMLNVHIATIGHTGKNPNAGERGSNARLGHVDLAVQISGEGRVRTAAVVKANDQPLRSIASFQIEEVTVDRRDLGPYTTAILAAATPAAEARPAALQRTTGKHARALDALKLAIAERGQDGAVHSDFWKEELAKAGVIKVDDKNPRATFKRIRDSITQHLIAEPNGLVRINPQPGNIPECPA